MSAVQMKASGVEWLGEIPTHWYIIPIHAVTLATGKHDPSREPDREFRYIDVSRICSDVHEITEYEQLAGRDAPTRARNVVYEGDTIFATVRPYLRNIAPIPIDLHDSICSTGYCVLRAKRTKVNPHYLFFSCISAGFVASVVAHQKGANYPAVSDYVVQRQVISLPPLTEQRAIAAYLDRETARIDALIAKTQQLNALLREKRVALISQAVTKGLDPAVELKDSGVKWLGEIPRHWQVERLKRISTVRTSNVDKKSVETEVKVSLLNYTDVYYNEYISDDIDFMQATATTQQIQLFELREGDVIVTKDSETWDDIAVPTCVERDLTGIVCAYHLALIRPNSDRTYGKYLARSFASIPCAYQFKVGANGVTRFGLPQKILRDAVFPLPPLAEQRAIAAHLDREAAKIDALITKNDELIALLREKRTALISAAVTGKIDLRNEV